MDRGGRAPRLSPLRRLVESIREPAPPPPIKDERCRAASGLDQVGDARPQVGGIGGRLVAQGVESGYGQLSATDTNGRGPPVSPVPLHACRPWRDLGERHL